MPACSGAPACCCVLPAMLLLVGGAAVVCDQLEKAGVVWAGRQAGRADGSI